MIDGSHPVVSSEIDGPQPPPSAAPSLEATKSVPAEPLPRVSFPGTPTPEPPPPLAAQVAPADLRVRGDAAPTSATKISAPPEPHLNTNQQENPARTTVAAPSTASEAQGQAVLDEIPEQVPPKAPCGARISTPVPGSPFSTEPSSPEAPQFADVPDNPEPANRRTHRAQDHMRLYLRARLAKEVKRMRELKQHHEQ
jgi:hypothetical protein